MTTSRNQNSVTLLHKGLGPSLFQFESKPFPVPVKDLKGGGGAGPVSVLPTPRSPIRYGGRQNGISSPKPGKSPKKRIVVQCLDRQDENTIFTKRLQERATRHYRPSTAVSRAQTSVPAQQQQCELYLKERLFNNVTHKPASFPPLSFMPRWNPRHKDRTYLSKMVLEDPWSLPAELRAELKNRTGLRLKSISKHYQYKVMANLPFGKDIDASTCACYIDFCEHCSKAHHVTHRCPLHMQLLDSLEPDCKTVQYEVCPFAKNPEDLPLDQIQDPAVYISEVVRRLRAGEIQNVPPFPSKFILEDHQNQNNLTISQKNIPASAEASADALDLNKRAITEDSCTQTEPFIVDVDMKAAFKVNMSQTQPPDKEEPLMLTSILRTIANQSHYRRFSPSTEVSTQVTPCAIQTFEERAHSVIKQITKQTMAQSLQEITNELRLQQLQRVRAHYTQRLVDLQRTTQFKYLQEKWRNNAYVGELSEIERETAEERTAEQSICAIGFSMSYLWNFPGKVISTLRRDGFIVNEDFKAINKDVREELNRLMMEKLRKRDESRKLLDEMINHAILNLEMDAFRSKMVDEKYLDPLSLTTKFLRDLVVLRDNNFEMIRRIITRLLRAGWYISEDGELVRGTPSSSVSSSDLSLDVFLRGVRVSIDSEGKPKYLVDITGKELPINVRWMPAVQEQVERNKDNKNWLFDVFLYEKSLSDTESQIRLQRKLKKADSGLERFSVGEEDMEKGEGEGLGLDLDYLGIEDQQDDDDDEDAGRLVFKRKDTYYENDDTDT